MATFREFYINYLKRPIDFILAILCLPFFVPIIFLLALLVYCSSSGPAFFIQERVGKKRQLFKLIKLRTMCHNSAFASVQITAVDDFRITRVGVFLRKYKLDELPQLWNILRGDLSFVGPRAEVTRYVQFYQPEWQDIFKVRPGLTDISSIVFYHEEEILRHYKMKEQAYVQAILPVKINLALDGIAKSSLVFDGWVILHTCLLFLGFEPALQESQKIVKLMENL